MIRGAWRGQRMLRRSRNRRLDDIGSATAREPLSLNPVRQLGDQATRLQVLVCFYAGQKLHLVS
jgi:hypothetical protein